jgi:hypothetical protein
MEYKKVQECDATMLLNKLRLVTKNRLPNCQCSRTYNSYVNNGAAKQTSHSIFQLQFISKSNTSVIRNKTFAVKNGNYCRSKEKPAVFRLQSVAEAQMAKSRPKCFVPIAAARNNRSSGAYFKIVFFCPYLADNSNPVEQLKTIRPKN